jgi:single-stranded-DNA-specific exonuclease
VLQPRFRWDLTPSPALDPALSEAARSLGISARVARLLARRGVSDPASLDLFYGPPERALHDPALLPDADRFCARVLAARRDGERVMVFGDFDADGLTGLAILVRVLRRMGLEVEPHVPSRLEDGHGLSMAAVRRAVELGVSLIITVDCGSTSVAEIQAAAAAGVQVLVTDHHRLPEQLPPAIAIVNPHRSDSRYPERSLAGSGVAFKLGQLLMESQGPDPEGAAFALDLADLAVIGTVADVAPVLGENRAIARLGLARLQRDPRPALAALMGRGGGSHGDRPRGGSHVDLETVAFTIAPRLNAAGRVGEAMDAASLLLTDDPADAARLADLLEAANGTRRDLTRQAIAEARTAPDVVLDNPATVVRGPWPVGIVGLVAARLSEEQGRPAVVGAELGELVRASCRSDGRLDLAAALGSCSDLLVRHGGHAGAAGFEVAAADWDAFRERFLQLAEAVRPADPRRSIAIDLEVPASAVDYELHRELASLAPCGPGHPDPVVLVRGLSVGRAREASGGHAQLTLRRERDVLDGVAFGWPELAREVVPGEQLDLVVRLSSRRFGGFESLQLEIRDAAASQRQPPAIPAAAIEGRP